jgi:hypothetical protein
MGRLVLLSPRIAVQKSDFLGSGVPYWPMELAVFAAFLRERGEEVEVVDLFGNSPGRLEDRGDHYLQGQPLRERIDAAAFDSAEAIILYALSYMSHRELVEICRELRSRWSNVPIAVLENSQAVTAYALSSVPAEFLQAGADVLICGEPYWNWAEIRAALMRRGLTDAPKNTITASSAGSRRSPAIPFPHGSGSPSRTTGGSPIRTGRRPPRTFRC